MDIRSHPLLTAVASPASVGGPPLWTKDIAVPDAREAERSERLRLPETPSSRSALESAALQTMADVRRSRGTRAEGIPNLSPEALAHLDILASVAEIRHAMVPPSLLNLDRKH